jgi:hypothetical protein
MDTRWKFYNGLPPEIKGNLNPLKRELGGYQSRSECGGKEKNLVLILNYTPVILLEASLFIY